MATTKNITMKQFNGTDYDTLYPKTVYNQVSGVAPAGYGLGETSPYIAKTSESGEYDADTIDKTGFFAAKTNTPTGNWCYGLHVNRNDSKAFQLLTSEFSEKEFALRKKISGVWQPWEWVNPPMKLGVEYRTTERYQGKPVYVSLINCGNMPSAGGSKAVQAPYDGTNNPITNAWIVHSHLSYYNQALPMYGYGNTVTVKAAAGVNSSGSITIYASEDTDLTNSSAILYVVLKYTKSTD